MKPHSARGLCANCARISKRDDTYDDFTRSNRTYGELLEEYTHLHTLGVSDAEIAQRLGYSTVDTMRATLWAARKRRAETLM